MDDVSNTVSGSEAAPVIESAAEPIDNSGATESTSEAHVETTESGTEQAATQEKMLSQSQVEKIVKREKRDTEKRVQEALNQQTRHYESQMAALKMQQGQPSGDTAVDTKISQAVQQHLQQAANAQQALQFQNRFEGKIQAEIQKDPDFADIYDELDCVKNINFALMSDEFDNTAAILRECGTNPSKYATILAFINTGNEALARKEMSKLSTSIKQNEASKVAKKAAPPLTQIKSSTQGMSDGPKTVSDFKSQAWLRG